MKGKTFNKSVAIMCLGFVLGTGVITGCSLVTQNYTKYYNAVAARIEYEDGSKIEITRKELRTAYNRYNFAQYVQQGSTQQEAYEKALDYLVSQKLAIRDAENTARLQNPNNEILTSKEKTYLYETVFEALKNNIDGYISNSDSNSNNEDKNDESGSVTRNVFKRQVDIKYDKDSDSYSIVFPEKEKTGIYAHDFWSKEDKDITLDSTKDEIYNSFVKYTKDDSAKKDAFNKYISELKESEKNFNYSKDTKSVFKREIDRVYGILYESFMIDKYTELITSQTTNNVLISDLLRLYESKVKTDYATYYNIDQVEKVKEKSKEIYYFNDGINWFTVSHILIKFDSVEENEVKDIKTEIENIKSGKENSYNGNLEQAEADLQGYYDRLSPVVRTNKDNVYSGEKDSSLNAESVLEIVKQELSKVSSEEQKASVFNDLIFKYNEDDGIFNSNYNYIVGVDNKTPSGNEDEVVKYTTYSNWVDSFNKAAVSLYNCGEGKVGDLYNGLIKSDYGYHIMMYTGKVGNVFNNISQNFKLQTNDILTLRETKLKAGEDKTLFDVLYEECVPETSTIFQKLDNERLRGQTQSITYDPKAF